MHSHYSTRSEIGLGRWNNGTAVKWYNLGRADNSRRHTTAVVMQIHWDLLSSLVLEFRCQWQFQSPARCFSIRFLSRCLFIIVSQIKACRNNAKHGRTRRRNRPTNGSRVVRHGVRLVHRLAPAGRSLFALNDNSTVRCTFPTTLAHNGSGLWYARQH